MLAFASRLVAAPQNNSMDWQHKMQCHTCALKNISHQLYLRKMWGKNLDESKRSRVSSAMKPPIHVEQCVSYDSFSAKCWVHCE